MNNGERLTKLYVRNLPLDFTAEQLEELLSRFNPTEVRLPVNDLGEHRGFAFVKVPTVFATSALSFLHKRRVGISTVTVIKCEVAARQ